MGCSIGIFGWAFIGLLCLAVPVASLFLLNKFRTQKYKEFHEGAARQTIQVNLMMISAALNAYRTAAATYPTTAQGLEALMERPTEPPLPSQWFSVLRELPKDPWKQPYKYRNPATKSKNGYDLYSVGSDGVDGTADDVGNWQ
ncbi:type II secretion system major pseudopilin GspG [Roseimicrobium gellanilyticum]|nr:type II secretion system major pseudopilin GspG [Roseimicrobium gellanilyticum]